jgi:hypothetical protein
MRPNLRRTLGPPPRPYFVLQLQIRVRPFGISIFYVCMIILGVVESAGGWRFPGRTISEGNPLNYVTRTPARIIVER